MAISKRPKGKEGKMKGCHSGSFACDIIKKNWTNDPARKTPATARGTKPRKSRTRPGDLGE